ncbi:hypothetical protein M413DRAFT_383869 [Hebeloma cylindrosporum]|uniref:Uncharacterized protein n=1 Tax=Hebeloma cylindrosporum TaxID=76867 RepID=A0A0C2YRA1_HEBCY|nr:hypothetical protein M413DRAFT_383869 [Hebeloma cylindrosporum h7]
MLLLLIHLTDLVSSFILLLSPRRSSHELSTCGQSRARKRCTCRLAWSTDLASYLATIRDEAQLWECIYVYCTKCVLVLCDSYNKIYIIHDRTDLRVRLIT